VPARPGNAVDDSEGYWVGNMQENDGNVLRRGVESLGLGRAGCDNHIGSPSNEFSCQTRNARRIAVGKPCFHVERLALPPAKLMEPLLECLERAGMAPPFGFRCRALEIAAVKSSSALGAELR